MSDDALREAERLFCDELWSIDDENPGWVSLNQVRMVVSIEVWTLMRAIRLGVGWRIQREMQDK